MILGQNDAGELRWYLSEYDELSDRFSDDKKFVWPCTSEAQACAIVQGQINEVKKPDRKLLDYAKKYGYTVKEEWEELVKTEEQAKRSQELEKARKELEAAQKRINELSQGTV